MLAENVFNVADKLLVPMIPTTLAVRTYAQLLSFRTLHGFDNESVYTFFSMVDGRKKMHRDLMRAVRKKFDNVLQTRLPYLSQVEQMGVKRAPVPAFAPNSVATQAYESMWGELID